ncbi:hypothetical protein ABZW18_02160 [Streptomyces sp. NPDC004647]|uniref:hypothetical protein n=1 Tax=Streptomyces sp. NPDC004647 TaxID=3154671 RepID=UPI0033B87DFC
MTHARSLSRHLRAAVFAAVCVVLAAAGHVSISGDHIPWQALLAAFGVTGAAAWLAGGRQRGVLPIGTGLLAVQAALHLLFDDGQRTAHPHTVAGTESASGSGGGSGAGTAMALHTADSAHGAAAMFTAHLLAGVCCALWLWRGEAAFFRLLRCLGALAFTPLRLLLAAAAPRPELHRPARLSPRTVPAGRTRSVLLAHVLSRRGPPYGAVSTHTALIGPPAPGI